MKNYLFTLLCFGICFVACGQHEDPRFIDGKVYVRLRTPDTTFGLSSPALLPLVATYHMDTCYRPFAGLGSDTLDRTYCIRFSDTAKTRLCLDTLRTLAAVELVEQLPVYHTTYVPNDIGSNQYSLFKIGAISAWNVSKGSPSVVIAIIDNAILATHQDLAGNMVAGYDVADNDANTSPPSGFTGAEWNHGTHTSGIASAVTDNGIGIASIGFNTKIMPVKCTSDTSATGGEIEFADEGISYAIKNGANVISMSFGAYQSSATEQILMNLAQEKNIVLVAAAGNDDSTGLFYPASYSGVISVGASDQNDVKASFSNYGSRIDVMAPGVSIYSTFATSNSAYGTFSGTSMACPLVAGLAGLVLAQNPGFSTAQVVSAIKNNADNISAENPNYNGQLGAGRINAYHTLGGVGAGVESLSAGMIKAYPNPFTNSFMVNPDFREQAILQLFDIEGRLILSRNIPGETSTEIETADLPRGAYLLKIITASGSETGRLVKM